MKFTTTLTIIILVWASNLYAQKKPKPVAGIQAVIQAYSESVLERDSLRFYQLFNDGPIVWCAALKAYSQEQESKKTKSGAAARKTYFSGSYKDFMRSLYRYKYTEDKFDRIHIFEDGTVANVTMDYSFWADGRMINWGRKLLQLIKRDGFWKITSVIYSIELTDHLPQPSFLDRQPK
ncbi:hypothetical protein [Pedobacter sp. BMA]|uniref:hypothetical protein n=1 Tax=Pedobacter sp. BMA TaxID=1663685 RepID=UPI00064ACDD4|nr:hypothetical protein [Pedobacter sp. BMA]KLT67079.1 hypothetical protein AB669_04065 [Pedobacter sp. BMA]